MIPKTAASADTQQTRAAWEQRAAMRLVQAVQDVSAARDMDAIMAVVRKAARELTGADGATFVLRDGDKCFYAAEDAISPLWQGQRFPLSSCISGWVMLNAQPAVIEDIYADARIPAAAYRPTFVKSLAMVPIRTENPVGAIGNYWATHRRPDPAELELLQALANVTAVAIENVGLAQRLDEKLHALEKSNEALSRFAWISSHDLKTPLRAVSHLAEWAEEDAGGALPEASREHLRQLRKSVARMDRLVDDLRDYSLADKVGREEHAGGGAIMDDVRQLTALPEGFALNVSDAFANLSLPRVSMTHVMANLVGNAVKHHDRKTGRIDVGVDETEAEYIIFVADDGPGVAPAYHAKIFELFQTLKPRDAVEGSGLGLALVRKILASNGSRIWVESQGRGATFRFNWPKPLE